MAGGYQTGIPDMDAAVKHVNEVAQAIQGRLQTLRGQVDATMGSWAGSGSASWDALMQRYDEDSRDLNAALQRIAELIGESSVILANVERDNVAANTRIASRLRSSSGG